MQLIYRAIVAGKPRRVRSSDDFFNLEDGVVDSNGTVLCPTCGCSQLVKATPRRGGEPYDGFVCRSGCSKTKKHAA